MSPVDPSEIPGISQLEVRVRRLMKGRHLGIHQSPMKGASVEFAEHRPYQPGDDLRDLDWKLFARTDRLYIKQYEKYTNLTAQVFLDGSASMDFGEKWDTAKLLSAAASYVLIDQGDQVGLTTMTENLERLPPSQGRGQQQAIFDELNGLEPSGNRQISPRLSRWLRDQRTPSLVFMVSDFLSEDLETLSNLLARARGMGHECIAIQVVSRDELDLPGDGPVRYRDPETGETVDTDVEGVRGEYRRQFRDFLNRVESVFHRYGFGYLMVVAEEKPGVKFGEFLLRRSRLAQSGRGRVGA